MIVSHISDVPRHVKEIPPVMRAMVSGLCAVIATIGIPSGARRVMPTLARAGVPKRTIAGDSGGLHLQVRLLDCPSWHPTLPASVQLIAPQLGRATQVDPAGRVWVAAVRAGDHRLRVRAFGYADTVVTFALATDRVDSVRISLGIPRPCFQRRSLD